MALACVFTLPGCDTTNGNDDPFVICPDPGDSPFDKTYTMDGDGCCILESTNKYTEEEIRKEVVGYGWKVVGTYEVQKDGRLSRQDYWKDMIVGRSASTTIPTPPRNTTRRNGIMMPNADSYGVAANTPTRHLTKNICRL